MKTRLIVLFAIVFGSVGMWCQTASSVPKTPPSQQCSDGNLKCGSVCCASGEQCCTGQGSNYCAKKCNSSARLQLEKRDIGDWDSAPTKPELLRIQAQSKKQFWFRIDCPSTIDPCRTFGVWATDQAAAQQEAQRNFTNCTVTPIDASQQAHACHN